MDIVYGTYIETTIIGVDPDEKITHAFSSTKFDYKKIYVVGITAEPNGNEVNSLKCLLSELVSLSWETMIQLIPVDFRSSCRELYEFDSDSNTVTVSVQYKPLMEEESNDSVK